jgi:DNA polymerase-3 subunit gamma/tau
VSYLVLARKYRPQSFEDLVGQSHVAKTLANAIAQGRVAHAFLFTGVRGVGKTTSARLLAKCLNCLGADGKAQGPTATPCQVCSACVEIAKGVDMDVQEIDAASYNGVDEVRRLQEGMGFRPARDRTKIYIVDEVHMLSNAAWNAFLKTLEEPPPHVKFIFATTEVHKVPVTILSRCQRYDFKLIPTQVVHERLADVLGKEGIASEPGALSVLAREAAGSMRDAMSLLDQVLAYGDATLTRETVTRVLGVASREVHHELARALVGGDGARALDVVDRVSNQGFDLVHFARDFLHHLRDLVVAKVNEGVEGDDWKRLLDLADEERADVVALAQTTSQDDLVRLYQGFSRSFDEIGRSGHPRATLEVTLVKLSRRAALLPLDELLSRLGELEKRLANGSPPPGPQGPSGGGSGGGGGAPRPKPAAARFDPTAALDSHEPSRAPRASAEPSAPVALAAVPAQAPAPAPYGAAPQAAPPARPVEMPRAPAASHAYARTPVQDDSFEAFFPRPGQEPAQEVAPAPTAAAPRPRRNFAVASKRAEAVDFSTFIPGPNDDHGPGLSLVPDAPPSEIVPKMRTLRAADALVAKVRSFVSRVREENAALAAHLEHAGPLELTAEKLVLGYEDGAFSALSAMQPEHEGLLARAAAATLGEGVAVVLDTTVDPDAIPMSVAALDAEARRKALEAARLAVANHPLVKLALEVFEADLRDVKLPQVAEG